MKKIHLSFLAMATISSSLFSQDICNCPQQTKVGKGTLYIAWGYNKDWYSKSDIHFQNHSNEYNPVTGKNDYYDFTLQGLKASDHLGVDHLLTTPLTIPQYVYRIGYYFNNKQDLGIEINFDHAKYIVDDYQVAHLKGNIRGKEYDQDTLISPDDFLHFQHTNGANFLMLNIMKRQTLFVSLNKKHWVSMVAKVGAGIVIPRTVVKLFGQEQNNYFHIAGYCAGVEAGFRYDAFKYIYLEYTIKGTFANYIDVLVVGPGKANHYFGAFENILSLGLQIPI
jgi:hypothetical protein